MDVRAEVRCGEEARTYPGSEFSHTDLSPAVVWCFPSCQNCSIERTHWAHPATALSQLLWRDKGGEVRFSLGENHEKASRFLDFLQRSTGREQ
jgi:hypothetical protein